MTIYNSSVTRSTTVLDEIEMTNLTKITETLPMISFHTALSKNLLGILLRFVVSSTTKFIRH